MYNFGIERKEKKMDLGEKLYELRKSKNLTQDDVAEKLNVTRQTVSKWETNQSTPDFDKIMPLCELYEISPNELLQFNNDEIDDEKEFDIDETKKHLFTSGKNDYENMSKMQIKQKSASIVSTSVFIYIIAVVFVMIAIPFVGMNPILAAAIFILLAGFGTVRIVKHYMSIPKFEKTAEEEKQDKLYRLISNIIGTIGFTIYLAVSFLTMAWHITWIIFIIMGIVDQIVRLIFMLKEEKKDE